MTDDAQYEATIAIYDDGLTAENALTTARDLESGDVAAAATVIHTWDGPIELEETRELSVPQGALAGGLVRAGLGVLFPRTVLAWAAGTAASGGLVGKLADEGTQPEPWRSWVTTSHLEWGRFSRSSTHRSSAPSSCVLTR